MHCKGYAIAVLRFVFCFFAFTEGHGLAVVVPPSGRTTNARTGELASFVVVTRWNIVMKKL